MKLLNPHAQFTTHVPFMGRCLPTHLYEVFSYYFCQVYIPFPNSGFIFTIFQLFNLFFPHIGGPHLKFCLSLLFLEKRGRRQRPLNVNLEKYFLVVVIWFCYLPPSTCSFKNSIDFKMLVFRTRCLRVSQK